MLITFEGKRVIVAGAARGIGHGIAVAFAENGGEVIACDRLFEEVEQFAGPAKNSSGAIRAAKVDVTDKVSIDAVVAQAGGPIDVLVYVAGGIRGQRPKPLEEVPVEDFHQIVDAKSRSTIFTRSSTRTSPVHSCSRRRSRPA
jgi:3-oxoacyl-[acyl-carrier protein] reductase